MINYTLPFFSITAATVLYGADKVIAYAGNDSISMASYFSTYIDLNYQTSINTIGLNAFIGIATCNGMYGNEFDMVELELSTQMSIEITEKFSLPVSCTLTTNP